MKAATLSKRIQKLIDLDVNAYHIYQTLRYEGLRVYCFGSYYTSNGVCFFVTDSGDVKQEILKTYP
jgi:hypothetical protein